MFYVLPLEQDITKKRWINNFIKVSGFELELSNDKEYKVEAIQDSEVYAKKANKHLLGLYYLIIWKNYPKKENIWEPFLVVIHLWKLVSTFYKDHPKKPIATSAPLDSTPPMGKPRIQLFAKRR